MASAETIENATYRFGAFELDARRRQLLRLGRPVAIQPKPFDLLVYLIRHRDRLVTRDELLAEVWRGVHVDDEALRFTLHATRRAVDDDGVRQQVIQTVPRTGFRLVAPVEEVVQARSREAEARAATASEPRTPFLGREALMAAVATLLGDVSGGASRVLLVSGEAGIGKTRALEEIAQTARSQGFRFFQGRCVESEGAPAFWPWVEILRAAVESDPPSGLLRALGEGAREVAWMVPELRPFVPDLPAPSLDPRAARFLLFDSVSAFFKELTAELPHVVAIDDLHRADPTSAALFLHVAREIGQSSPFRLLLVASYREGELRAAPALADPVAAVATLQHARHERLAGLEPAEIATLVQLLSRRVPTEAVVSDLHATTQGNPFFLNQIVRVLESESRLEELDSVQRIELELPPHVQDVIRLQLRVLPAEVRELAEIASVIGGEFRVGELEMTAELESAQVLARLGVAVEASVVRPHAGEPSRYRFTHALVRDAIYAGLPLDLRARLHARAARALERGVAEQASAESGSIAHHYAQSPEPADQQRAVHFYELAATWSTARGAFEDAPAHVERALALLDESQPGAAQRKCRLLLQLGDALTNAGQRERAREVLLAAAELAQQQGLHEEMANAALKFAPDSLAIEFGVFDSDLVGLLERAIGSAGFGSTRARLIARLAIALQWNADQGIRSRRLLSEAQVVSSQCEDQDTKQYVDTAGWLMNYAPKVSDRMLSETSEHYRSEASVGLLQGLLRVTSLMVLGRIDDSDAEILRFSELVERMRYPHVRWYAELMQATRAEMEGRYHDADVLASRFLALGTKYGDRNAVHSYEAKRVMRSFDVGQVELVESGVRSMAKAFPRTVAWRAGLVLVLVELNRIDEARAELHRIVASGRLATLNSTEWYVTTALLSLALASMNEPAVAKRLYAALLPFPDQLVVFGFCTYCLGSTQRLLAALAAGMQRWDTAAAHFEAALCRNLEIGARACNSRVLFEYAATLNRAGRPSEAIQYAQRAERAASEFGMKRLARMSRDLSKEIRSSSK